jgi:replicative DNA helicase
MAKKEFTTIDAAERLMESMEVAIDNMIQEVRHPIAKDITGSARKAELQSVKMTATDCKELLVERQKLHQMVTELRESGEISKDKDYSGGFAEKYSRK